MSCVYLDVGGECEQLMDGWILLLCEGSEEGNGIVMDGYEKNQGVSCFFMFCSFHCFAPVMWMCICEASSLLFSLSLFFFYVHVVFFVFFFIQGCFSFVFRISILLFILPVCMFCCFDYISFDVVVDCCCGVFVISFVHVVSLPCYYYIYICLLFSFPLFLSYVLQKQCVSLSYECVCSFVAHV